MPSHDQSHKISSLSKDFTIETHRCRLRIAHENDLPLIFSATRTPGFNDGMLWEPPLRIDDLYEPHKKLLEAWNKGSAYSFSIEFKDTHEFVGRISIRKV